MARPLVSDELWELIEPLRRCRSGDRAASTVQNHGAAASVRPQRLTWPFTERHLPRVFSVLDSRATVDRWGASSRQAD